MRLDVQTGCFGYKARRVVHKPGGGKKMTDITQGD